MAKQTPLTCSGHTRPVVDLAYSRITPDGFFLISACKDSKPMIRAGQTGDWIGTFEGHKGAVWGCALDVHALKAATASADFTAKVWDAISGEELMSFSHPHIVKGVDFNEDSTKLLTACNDKVIRIFDLRDKAAAPIVLLGHTAAPKKALFCRDNNKVISAGDDKTIRVWDVRAGTSSCIAVENPVTGLDFSQDGRLLVLTQGKVVMFWDVATMTLVKQAVMVAPVYTASIHPDGRTFVWGGPDNIVHVVDYETLQQTDEYKGHFGPIHCVRFSPDGEIYASGSEDGTVRLWQTRVGTEYGLWKVISPPDLAEGKL